MFLISLARAVYGRRGISDLDPGREKDLFWWNIIEENGGWTSLRKDLYYQQNHTGTTILRPHFNLLDVSVVNERVDRESMRGCRAREVQCYDVVPKETESHGFVDLRYGRSGDGSRQILLPIPRLEFLAVAIETRIIEFFKGESVQREETARRLALARTLSKVTKDSSLCGLNGPLDGTSTRKMAKTRNWQNPYHPYLFWCKKLSEEKLKESNEMIAIKMSSRIFIRGRIAELIVKQPRKVISRLANLTLILQENRDRPFGLMNNRTTGQYQSVMTLFTCLVTRVIHMKDHEKSLLRLYTAFRRYLIETMSGPNSLDEVCSLQWFPVGPGLIVNVRIREGIIEWELWLIDKGKTIYILGGT
ncbi:hypothetical protein DINM_005649, partial [Dirofilaria immitis]|nr:hypothetical protein [Dirofilaria immitis]